MRPTWWTHADDPWSRPRPDRAGVLKDLRLATALAVLGLVLGFSSRASGYTVFDDSAAPWVQTLLVLATAFPLALRRVAPVPVGLWVSLMLPVWQLLHVSEMVSINIYVFIAFQAIGAWTNNRRLAHATRLLIVAVMAVYLVSTMLFTSLSGLPGNGYGPLNAATAYAIYEFTLNLVYFLAAYYFGETSWLTAKQEDSLRRRTEELNEERERSAHTAVLGERVRIARELHDVIAHSVTVIGVQAAAARRSLGEDPEVTATALTSVEDTARDTVDELRGMLGVLRSDDETEPNSPAPGLRDLEELATLARDSGLEATVTVVGDEAPVGDAVAVSLYRVAQEAVTNTLKHAGAGRVDVRLRYRPGSVELEVVDDGVGPAQAGPSAGTRLGHIGMRERMALHGGDVEAGPRIGRAGYRVLARVPVKPR